MKRLIQMPRRFFSALGQFVNPRLKAGRVPLGRIAIVVQLIAALVFVGYTLTKKGFALPFSDSRYEVEVVFSDAKGLDKYDQPAAGVAGAYAGQVTNVRYENGHAVATLTLNANVRGKIFADASAALRPASAIQNLLVDVDPGNPEAGALPDGEPIPQEQTTTYVAIDELTSVLDSDTQAYVQILVNEAQRALQGREGDLRHALVKLGDIAETATPVSRALAERRKLLTQLVDHLDVLFTTVATRGDELGGAIDAGQRTLAVTARRETELAAVTRQLAPLFVNVERSLQAGRELADLILPALDQVVPAASSLAADAGKLRDLIPIAQAVFDQTGELVDRGELPLNLLERGTVNLDQKMRDLVPVVQEFVKRNRILDHYKEGTAQFADLWSGAFSTNDNGGVVGLVDVLKLDPPLAENFGFAPASAAASGGTDSKLATQLATALENVCREQGPLACLVRWTTPGLPRAPLTTDAEAGGGSGEGQG